MGNSTTFQDANLNNPTQSGNLTTEVTVYAVYIYKSKVKLVNIIHIVSSQLCCFSLCLTFWLAGSFRGQKTENSNQPASCGDVDN